MESNILRARGPGLADHSQSIPSTPTVKPTEPEEPRYGPAMEGLRLVLFLTYFISATLAMHVCQLLSAPVYFYKKDYFYTWNVFTKQSYGVFLTLLTQWFAPTPVIVSGDESVLGQLKQTADGRLQTDFPERLVLIANHQLYTDWLYLWWIAYTSKMHGHIFIVLKDVFKWVPVIGPAMQMFGFIFMTRKWATDQVAMAYRLEKLRASHGGPMSGSPGLDPMWMLIYPEGTNMSANTRKKSQAWAEKAGLEDLRHQVLPRSTGFRFVLDELKGTVDYVYDVTVGYGGIPHGLYGQDIFGLRSTYIKGRPPSSVNFYFRRYAVKDIPTDSKAFEEWVLKIWREKDDLLEQWQNTGRFPPSPSNNGDPKSGGWIETEVKLGSRMEAATLYTPFLALCLLVSIVIRLWNFMFHGSFALF